MPEHKRRKLRWTLVLAGAGAQAAIMTGALATLLFYTPVSSAIVLSVFAVVSVLPGAVTGAIARSRPFRYGVYAALLGSFLGFFAMIAVAGAMMPSLSLDRVLLRLSVGEGVVVLAAGCLAMSPLAALMGLTCNSLLSVRVHRK